MRERLRLRSVSQSEMLSGARHAKRMPTINNLRAGSPDAISRHMVTKTFVRSVSKKSRVIQRGVHSGMGTIDVLRFEQEINASQQGVPSSFGSKVVKMPWPSRAIPSLIQLPNLTSVLIRSESEEFRVYGWLKSLSRGGILALTSLPVPVRHPLEIAIAGCVPVKGHALYCLKRATVRQTGIVLSSWRNPGIHIGAAATLHSLDAPFIEGRGNVLDVASNTASILCKAEVSPGTWVRIETEGWVLFGVVRDLVPISAVGRCLEIYVEAAFQADKREKPEPAAPAEDDEDSRPLVTAGGDAEGAN